jgi:hypothetical protein
LTFGFTDAAPVDDAAVEDELLPLDPLLLLLLLLPQPTTIPDTARTIVMSAKRESRAQRDRGRQVDTCISPPLPGVVGHLSGVVSS